MNLNIFGPTYICNTSVIAEVHFLYAISSIEQTGKENGAEIAVIPQGNRQLFCYIHGVDIFHRKLCYH
jgi:hypothetical protein